MTLALPNPRTWSVGDLTTAAEMNTEVRDSVGFIQGAPICVLNQLTAQSIPDSTFTGISFDTAGKVVDNYNGHSATNLSRYIAPIAGWYLAIGRASASGTADKKRIVTIAVNGTPQRANEQDSPDPDLHVPYCAALVYCNGTTDYIEVQLFQGNGAALLTNVSALYYGSSLEIIWVHS